MVGVPGDRAAGDLGGPGRRAQERGQDAQGRRLAGAVGPDEAEDLARLDRQVDAGDGERAVVALDEAVGPHDRAHSMSPLIATSSAKLVPSSARR